MAFKTIADDTSNAYAYPADTTSYGVPYMWHTEQNSLSLTRLEEMDLVETGVGGSYHDPILHRYTLDSGAPAATGITPNTNLADFRGNDFTHNGVSTFYGMKSPMSQVGFDLGGKVLVNEHARTDDTGQAHPTDVQFWKFTLNRQHSVLIDYEFDTNNEIVAPISNNSTLGFTSTGSVDQRFNSDANTFQNNYNNATDYIMTNASINHWNRVFRSKPYATWDVAGSGLLLAAVQPDSQNAQNSDIYLMARLRNSTTPPIHINNFMSARVIGNISATGGAANRVTSYVNTGGGGKWLPSNFADMTNPDSDGILVRSHTDWILIGVSSGNGIINLVQYDSDVNEKPYEGIMDFSFNSFAPVTFHHVSQTDYSTRWGEKIISRGGRIILASPYYQRPGVTPAEMNGAVVVYDNQNLGNPKNELAYLSDNRLPSGPFADRHYGADIAASGQWLVALRSSPKTSTTYQTTAAAIYLSNMYDTGQWNNNGADSFGGGQSSRLTLYGMSTDHYNDDAVGSTTSGGIYVTGGQPAWRDPSATILCQRWSEAKVAAGYNKIVVTSPRTGSTSNTAWGGMRIYDMDPQSGYIKDDWSNINVPAEDTGWFVDRHLLSPCNYDPTGIASNITYASLGANTTNYSTNPLFGHSVDIGCGRIVVGAPNMRNYWKNDDGNDPVVVEYPGSAFLFDIEGGFLTRLHVPTDLHPVTHIGDSQDTMGVGWDVSIGCGIIAVAAPNVDREFEITNQTLTKTNCGDVYIFDLNGNFMFSLYDKFEKQCLTARSRTTTGNYMTWIAGNGYVNPYVSTSSETMGISKIPSNFGTSVSVAFGRIIVGSGHDYVYEFDLDGKLDAIYKESQSLQSVPEGATEFGVNAISAFGKIIIGKPGAETTPAGYAGYDVRDAAATENGCDKLPDVTRVANFDAGAFFSVEADPKITVWDALELTNEWDG